MLRTAFAVGLVALVAGSPTAGCSFAGIPGAEMRYYDVSGQTVAQIRASLNQHRRTDPNTGERVDAWTAWDLRWGVPGSPEGECRPDKAVVTLDVTVGLPRLVGTDTVPPDVLQRWQRYSAAIEAHEANHVRIAYEGRDAVLRAIRGSDCLTGPQAARAAMEAMDRRNDAYDRVTRNGWTEGAHFP